MLKPYESLGCLPPTNWRRISHPLQLLPKSQQEVRCWFGCVIISCNVTILSICWMRFHASNHMQANEQTLAHTHTLTHTPTPTHTHMCRYIYIYTHAHAYMHPCFHSHAYHVPGNIPASSCICEGIHLPKININTEHKYGLNQQIQQTHILIDVAL